MMTGLARKMNCLLILLISLWGTLVQATQLQDPTRPFVSFGFVESEGKGLKTIRLKEMVDQNKPNNREYRVNFIRVSEGSAWAMVNGQQVSVGERIAGATVISILHNAIVLKIDNKLVLFNSYVKGEFK